MLDIKNTHGEKLDVVIEGNPHAAVTVVLIHGFGTDKHDAYFDDAVKALSGQYRLVRFDFSGCGNSEGLSEAIDYQKQSEDLQVILTFVKNTFPGDIYILAQSMGCFVTVFLNPSGIKKTVFSGIPNTDTSFIIKRTIEHFEGRNGASINLDTISLLPRSSGKIQKIGPNFWKILQNFAPVESVKAFARNTNLLIIHPKHDDVVGTELLENYSKISEIQVAWLNGDHSFTNHKDRDEFIEKINEFFST